MPPRYRWNADKQEEVPTETAEEREARLNREAEVAEKEAWDREEAERKARCVWGPYL